MNRLLLIPFLLSSLSIQGQISAGARVGLNYSVQTARGTEFQPENIIGIALAGLLEVGIHRSFALQPELNWVVKGFKTNSVNTLGEEFELKFELGHLEVPLLVKYKIGQKSLQGYLCAGPAIGYAVNGYVTAYGDVVEKFGAKEWTGYRRTELGGIGGGGIQAGSKKLRLVMDVRYLFSLHNLSKEPGVNTRNRGLCMSAGFLAGL